MTEKRAPTWLRLVLLAIVAGGIPALILEYGRYTPFWAVPFAVIFGLWGVLLLVSGVRRKRRDGKGAWAFNLGILCLALAGAEVYLGAVAKQNTRLVRREAPGTFARLDPDLGFRSRPGFTSRFTSMTGEETIFDVVYTIGEDGLRVRPPLADPPP